MAAMTRQLRPQGMPVLDRIARGMGPHSAWLLVAMQCFHQHPARQHYAQLPEAPELSAQLLLVHQGQCALLCSCAPLWTAGHQLKAKLLAAPRLRCRVLASRLMLTGQTALALQAVHRVLADGPDCYIHKLGHATYAACMCMFMEVHATLSKCCESYSCKGAMNTSMERTATALLYCTWLTVIDAIGVHICAACRVSSMCTCWHGREELRCRNRARVTEHTMRK